MFEAVRLVCLPDLLRREEEREEKNVVCMGAGCGQGGGSAELFFKMQI